MVRNEEELRNWLELHKNNPLFYTTSPPNLVAIAWAFNMVEKAPIVNRLKEKNAFYEFGVFKGFCLWFAEWYSRKMTTPCFRYYGFDSFKGYPKSKEYVHPISCAPGNYASPKEFALSKMREYGTDLSKVKLFEGFYSKEYFEEIERRENLQTAAICIMDVDLRESYREALRFMTRHIGQDTILIFGGWGVKKREYWGPWKAVEEFEEENPTIILAEIFDICGRKAFQVRDL